MKISIFKWICVKIPIGLRRHVGLRWASTGMLISNGACKSLMGHVGRQWGMSVLNEACQGLRWVFDEACPSLMGLRYFSKRSPLINFFYQ